MLFSRLFFRPHKRVLLVLTANLPRVGGRHALQPRESSSRKMQIQGAGDMQGSKKLLRVSKDYVVGFLLFIP